MYQSTCQTPDRHRLEIQGEWKQEKDILVFLWMYKSAFTAAVETKWCKSHTGKYDYEFHNLELRMQSSVDMRFQSSVGVEWEERQRKVVNVASTVQTL